MKGKCKECRYYDLASDEEPCVHCCAYSEYVTDKQTNAEKIRSLSDEELATIFCTYNWTLVQYSECLAWLKSEAKE